MNSNNPTGLGEPVVSGKRSLFRPPEPQTQNQLTTEVHQKTQNQLTKKEIKPQSRRVRTTIELTPKALIVIQEVQQRYRLKTGKVLPLWKAVSQAIEQFGNANKASG